MIEIQDFRDAMARLGAAVNIVTTDGVGGRHGLTVSAVCSVSDNPPTVLVCINRSARANKLFKENGVLCVNVLTNDHQELSNRFASKAMDSATRFGDPREWETLSTGSPALCDAAIALDCTITSINEAGSHSVLFCEVAAVKIGRRLENLIYFNRSYHCIRANAA